MGKLIDAGILKIRLENENRLYESVFGKPLCNTERVNTVVDSQMVAYDVDQVIKDVSEQLESVVDKEKLDDVIFKIRMGGYKFS